MTSNHMDSDPPGLSALKHLFETAFVFGPADKSVYKLWLTVKNDDHERKFREFGEFMEAFSRHMHLSFNPAKLHVEEDRRNGTLMYEYSFPSAEIERPAKVDTLTGLNIGHALKDTGQRFLQLGKEVREEGEQITQKYFEMKVLDELHLATGVEWTIREARGARSYEPLLPVPNAYGALATLCARNCLNLEDCVPDTFQSGKGMIRIPVEALTFEHFSGLKGKDISGVFADPKRGFGGPR